jgi:hypothetical protein
VKLSIFRCRTCLCASGLSTIESMDSLKVYPGILKGRVEHYYRKFHLHRVTKLATGYTSFVCTTMSDGFVCWYTLKSRNADHKPGKFVSILFCLYRGPMLNPDYPNYLCRVQPLSIWMITATIHMT